MIIIVFPANLSWRSRVGVSSLGFLLTDGIVVVYPDPIADDDAIKIVVRIYFALLPKLLTTIHSIVMLKWFQQFRYPPYANLLHVQWIVHDLMDGGFWNGQFVSYATDRDLLIMQYDPSTALMLSSVVMINGRLIRGASSKPHSRFLNPATHLATVRYNGAEFL